MKQAKKNYFFFFVFTASFAYFTARRFFVFLERDALFFVLTLILFAITFIVSYPDDFVNLAFAVLSVVS